MMTAIMMVAAINSDKLTLDSILGGKWPRDNGRDDGKYIFKSSIWESHNLFQQLKRTYWILII